MQPEMALSMMEAAAAEWSIVIVFLGAAGGGWVGVAREGRSCHDELQTGASETTQQSQKIDS